MSGSSEEESEIVEHPDRATLEFYLFNDYLETSREDILGSVVECMRAGSDSQGVVAGLFAPSDEVNNVYQLLFCPEYAFYTREAESRFMSPWADTGGWPEVREISIPNDVRELCSCCFQGCRNLRRVTFGSSSRLEKIGDNCFRDTGVEEVSIPNSVRELGTFCFQGCKSLRRVTFGSSSVLEKIGVDCFRKSGVEEVSIPDSVRELCDDCFRQCKSLRVVTFGSSSSLERIGLGCFHSSGLVQFEIPVSVREICGGAFGQCALPGGVVCRDVCRFRVFDGVVLSCDCER